MNVQVVAATLCVNVVVKPAVPLPPPPVIVNEAVLLATDTLTPAPVKSKYEAEMMKNICKICFEREINTVILDCHHRFICYDCSLKFEKNCPACKGEIKRILKTYS